MLGLGGNPVIGDALYGLGMGLLGLGSGNPQNAVLGLQAIQQRRQDRLANTRQAQMDQRSQQEFEWRKKQYEDQIKAQQDAAARQQQLRGSLTPDQQKLFDLDPSGFADRFIQQQMPIGTQGAAPIVKDFYEGGSVVQKQWNPQSNAWEVVGRGPRWQPPQDTGRAAEYGLNPIYATDDKGNLYAYQPSKGGGIAPIQFPDGQRPTQGMSFQDLGTNVLPMGQRTGLPAAPAVSKDVAGEAGQKIAGASQAQATIDLPSVENNARIVKKTIQDIIDSPGREAGTGLSSLFNPMAIPGSDRSNFLAAQDQLKGQVFLSAYESLKGGGQITEIEGAKAEQAKARLQTAQSESEYLKALKDFSAEVDNLVEISRKKAKGGGSVSQGGAAPTVIKYDAQGNRIQ